jgi:hypothetical protein
MHLRDKPPDVMHQQLVERRLAGRQQQFLQIAPVIDDGMRRQPTLIRQFAQISVDCLRGRHSALLVTRASAAETISPIRSRYKVPMSA